MLVQFINVTFFPDSNDETLLCRGSNVESNDSIPVNDTSKEKSGSNSAQHKLNTFPSYDFSQSQQLSPAVAKKPDIASGQISSKFECEYFYYVKIKGFHT